MDPQGQGHTKRCGQGADQSRGYRLGIVAIDRFEIPASPRKHLEERYGGIEAYMRTSGLSAEEVERLQNALVR